MSISRWVALIGLTVLAGCASAASSGHPIAASELPYSVSAAAISGEPLADADTLSGGKRWGAVWKRDRQSRELIVYYLVATGRQMPEMSASIDTLHAMAFREGLTEDRAEADVRKDNRGSMAIWGGEAEWLLGSERAELNPMDPTTPASSNGKAVRGDVRRYCTSFIWHSPDERRMFTGIYCKVDPAGADGVNMLQALDLRAS